MTFFLYTCASPLRKPRAAPAPGHSQIPHTLPPIGDGGSMLPGVQSGSDQTRCRQSPRRPPAAEQSKRPEPLGSTRARIPSQPAPRHHTRAKPEHAAIIPAATPALPPAKLSARPFDLRPAAVGASTFRRGTASPHLPRLTSRSPRTDGRRAGSRAAAHISAVSLQGAWCARRLTRTSAPYPGIPGGSPDR